ncbi:MAG: helix-turn-helix transcriptional regulator [Robiginitomaculum sp.]
MRVNICGPKIKNLRKQFGMAQIDLAEALNVDHSLKFSQSDISEMERGVRGIRDFELKAIADIFDIHPGELFE